MTEASERDKLLRNAGVVLTLLLVLYLIFTMLGGISQFFQIGQQEEAYKKASEYYGYEDCSQISVQSDREECLIVSATKNANASICNAIQDKDRRAICAKNADLAYRIKAAYGQNSSDESAYLPSTPNELRINSDCSFSDARFLPEYCYYQGELSDDENALCSARDDCYLNRTLADKSLGQDSCLNIMDMHKRVTCLKAFE